LNSCKDDGLEGPEVIQRPDPFKDPRLVVKPFVALQGELATLNATIVNNPYQAPLRFYWEEDPLNPALSELENVNDTVVQVKVPWVPGEYYYNLLVVTEKDSSTFQTMLIREEDGLRLFDVDSEAPPWMENAVIYEITHYNFVQDGTYPAITEKLPEIKKLGANTIWLQPVYKTSSKGQGYDVVDFFSLNPALGSELELRQLISMAKGLDMRVLFDIPLSQTSIGHPYAKSVMAKGEGSEYYDHYQHENPGGPYSSLMTEDGNGFMHYFWDDLVVLNYESEEVQRWMIDACKYWITKYDIDGYRFDAIWGVNSRKPSFGKRLRSELKSIKPDILLLAEDKGSDPAVFQLGFDSAYDWTTDMMWVSQWSWEYDYDESESKTIFNHPDIDSRGHLLRQALFQNSKDQYRLLRFMENNDLPRFIDGHGLQRTKMVAALLFSVPGIPMLYNGQEVGFRGHPYSTNAVFSRNSTIEDMDDLGLFVYYKKLTGLHQQHPALSGDEPMEKISVSPKEAMVAFRRGKDDQNFIIVINMNDGPAIGSIELGQIESFTAEGNPVLLDILTGDKFSMEEAPSQIQIPMEGSSVRWLLIK
tara:strand:- start:59018 stop:60781 length:1764 start_codon:yes stop_codon:yes gene_type:complete